jgi:hypothetical protein
MLERAFKLRQVCSAPLSSILLLITKLLQPIQLFVATADQRFGPITTIRINGRVVKHIPWTAFTFSDDDWSRVKEAADLLEVHGFISDSGWIVC